MHLLSARRNRSEYTENVFVGLYRQNLKFAVFPWHTGLTGKLVSQNNICIVCVYIYSLAVGEEQTYSIGSLVDIHIRIAYS